MPPRRSPVGRPAPPRPVGRPAALLALLLVALAAGPLRPREVRAQASAPEVAFRHLTDTDGLSSSRIHALLQDRRGFLWIGTVDGLNRYDGYAVAPPYRHADDDPTTIGGDDVRCLLEARDGALWVGTAGGGLSRFDPATERFTTFRHDRRDPRSLPSDDVLALAEAGASGLWVGTRGGLARLDLATGRFARFAHDPRDPRSLPHDEVTALHVDRRGGLWVGTLGGLGWLAPRAAGFRAYRPADEAARAVSALEGRERGGLWVGTRGSGLQAFDPRAGAFTPVPLGEGISASAVSALANTVSALYEDAQGTLWVGTNGGGLRELPVGGAPVTHRHDAAEPASLSEDAVSTVFQDRQGVLWVGTYGGLDWFDRARGFTTVLRHDPDRPASLPSSNVRSVLEARDGTLWVGTDRGLARSEDGALTRFTTIPTGRGEHALRDPTVSTLYQDREGTLWIGTNVGVDRLDARTGRISHLAPLAQNVSTFFEDSSGRLWIGTRGRGLAILDKRSGRLSAFRHDPRRPSSLASDEVWAIAQGEDGAVWIGTAGGLDRLDSGAAGGRFTHFRNDANPTSLPGGAVLALRARADGTLWIGTNGGGLARYEPQRPQAGFTRYTESNSDLPSDVVRAIVEDEAGFLWLSTGRGLVRFDPVPETFRPFDIGGGELTRAARRGRSGRLYFGTSAGLVAFTPGQASAVNPNPPQIALTGLRLLDNKLVRPSLDGPLRAALPLASEVRLDHDQNALTFEFAALHFSEPARNTYAYRLDGRDPDWVRAGTQRTATYSGLDPGTYTFRVKAASADGVESEEEATIRVVVAPPWWRTTWAYGFYVLLGAAAVYGVDRVQRQRVRREERERAALAERELRAVMAETEARALRAENEMKAAELEKAREVEEANAALATSNVALEASLRDLQATQAQLVQAEKLASLGALTAGIAHEIKNPLNFVNNFAELSVELTEELSEELRANAARPVGEALAEVGDLLDDLQENARRIHEHGQRADRIVQAMLLHTRGGTGERVRTDVNRLVEEYANLAYHGMRAKESNANVAVEREFDPQAGEAELVPQEIGRVLINLLNNAFYAVMGRARAEGPAYQPTVTVSTRRVASLEPALAEAGGEAVEIRVADNGPGIPEEVKARIFEPFFTTKPSGEGTGLGLSLAYDIVAGGHGGALAVESEEGVGTTFILSIPAAPAGGVGADGASLRAARAPSSP